MRYFPRSSARRSLTAATAEQLLAGGGVRGDAPTGQQALARVLEAAARSGSEQELAGEVAAAAAFVQVASRARSRAVTRRTLAAAACVVTGVCGAVAYTSVMSPMSHPKVRVPYGVPPTPAAVHAPRVPASPAPQPGMLRTSPGGQSGYRAGHPVISPRASPGPAAGNKPTGCRLPGTGRAAGEC